MNARLAALLGVAALSGLAACGGSSSHHPVAATTPSPSLTPSASPTVVAARPTYPLTGQVAADHARLSRPAVSVKIDNIGAALPQVGLNHADIVTDILVEGGLTRLMATFQSQDATKIGPIRSARPVDADLLRELNGGIFAYSGADRREIAPVKDHSTALLVSNDADPRWFWRDHSRSAPHNVFSSTDLLYKAGRTLAPHLKPPPQLFTYSRTAPATAVPASAVTVPFSPISTAAWRWNGRAYLRTQNGAPDRLADGSRISATDIVILSVTWRPTSIIDDAGNADPYVIVTGSGKAWVLRNGRMIAGHWTRGGYRAQVRLTDASGHVIALAPGRTWIELQPRPYAPTFTK